MPDAELVDRKEREEAQRIKQRRKQMGKDGLKKCAQELANAVAANEVYPFANLDAPPLAYSCAEMQAFDQAARAVYRQRHQRRAAAQVAALYLPAAPHEILERQ